MFFVKNISKQDDFVSLIGFKMNDLTTAAEKVEEFCRPENVVSKNVICNKFEKKYILKHFAHSTLEITDIPSGLIANGVLADVDKCEPFFFFRTSHIYSNDFCLDAIALLLV